MNSLDISLLLLAIMVSVAIICFTAYEMLTLYLDRAYERDDEEEK